MAIEEMRWPNGPSPGWDSSDKWAIAAESPLSHAQATGLLDEGDGEIAVFMAWNNTLSPGHIWRIATRSPAHEDAVTMNVSCPVPLLLGRPVGSIPSFQLLRIAECLSGSTVEGLLSGSADNGEEFEALVSEIESAVFDEEERAPLEARRTYGEVLNFMVPVDLTRLAATVYGGA